MKYSVAVDLGGTKICAALVDTSYRILAKKVVPTGAQRSSEEILADIAAVALAVAKENGAEKEEITKLGIVVPGAVLPDSGTLAYSCNLPFRNFPITRELSRLTGIETVRLANDANAAALGESVMGAAKGSRSSVMVTLGTGVGGGYILDGKIQTGINGAAAELGHMVIRAGGELCTCGRRGCFEVYASATALKRITCEAIIRCQTLGIPTLMIDAVGGNADQSDTRTAFDAAKKGDAEAQRVLSVFTENLACGLTNLINIYQPEVLSIGGGLSGEGDYLLKPLLPIIDREQYTRSVEPKTVIRIAQLGNDAGLIGAAAL